MEPISSIDIITENKLSRCIEFASKELERYLASYANLQLGTVREIVLKADQELDCDDDSFSIEINNAKVILSGAGERAVLFAVYTFLEEYCGLRFLHICEQTAVNCITPRKIQNGIKKYKPAFSFRAIYMENTEFQLELIDWMAKNKINWAIISLQSWWSMEEKIIAEIEKRGMGLALGGHSYLDFLKPDEYFSEHPEWYAMINGSRAEYGQICFANEVGRRKLFENLYDYLKNKPSIKRLALCPVDNKHYCQCTQCSKKSFLELNCGLMGGLEDHLNNKGLDIKVEHLAYNASLSREMFDVPAPAENILKIDTRVAYWGRNYHQTISESTLKTDSDAWDEIKAWGDVCKAVGQKLHIIEYYTDFWMMTTLFPILGKVIAKDMASYRALPAEGISTLVVQPPQPPCYPWHKYVELNIYIFAKYCWDTEYELDQIMDDYFTARFGSAAGLLKSYYEILQDSLPELTGFNISLFRMRFSDIWNRDEAPADGGTRFVPAEWTPETICSKFDEDRWKFTKFLYEKTKQIDIEKINCTNLSHREKDEVRDAVNYLSYIQSRIESLYIQQKAQKAIVAKAWSEAEKLLAEALELEEKFYSEDSKYCRKWLEQITRMVKV